MAADKPVVQKLMPATVGLDASGNATPALLKKLAALGADASAVASLRRENDGKADILFYDSLAKGATLAEGLQKAVEAALAALPIPKVMTYQLAWLEQRQFCPSRPRTGRPARRRRHSGVGARPELRSRHQGPPF